MINPPFLLGPDHGGAVNLLVHRARRPRRSSTGAPTARSSSIQGQHQARRPSAVKASVEDSNKVVEICTLYAQKGMKNIFMVVFFSTWRSPASIRTTSSDT